MEYLALRSPPTVNEAALAPKPLPGTTPPDEVRPPRGDTVTVPAVAVATIRPKPRLELTVRSMAMTAAARRARRIATRVTAIDLTAESERALSFMVLRAPSPG
jgi:hypothetical protein